MIPQNNANGAVQPAVDAAAEKPTPPSLGLVQALGLIGELACWGILALMVFGAPLDFEKASHNMEEAVETNAQRMKDIEAFFKRFLATKSGELNNLGHMVNSAIIAPMDEVTSGRDPELARLIGIWIKMFIMMVPTISLILFLFAFGCCVGCACCCGVRKYTRLKVTMVFMLLRIPGIFSLLGFKDPTLYFSVALPIFFFIRYGWNRADEYDEPVAAAPQIIIMQMAGQVQAMQPQGVQAQQQPPAAAHDWGAQPFAQPQDDFFRSMVQSLATILEVKDQAKVDRAVMFIKKMFEQNQKMPSPLKSGSCESFWLKQKASMRDRLKSD